MSNLNATTPLPFLRYPEAKPQVARGLLVAVALHLFVASLVCLIFFLLGIRSLKDLLLQGAIATSGPAPNK